jgi:hypothetical protein
MNTTMNRRVRRKANAKERKFLPKDCEVVEVNLSDPNLSPEHRNRFIEAVRGKVAALDEMVAGWYRHRGQCRIEGCNCGRDVLAEGASIMCSHLYFIKQRFGEYLIADYPHFNRFVKEGLEPNEYEELASRNPQ